jgi:hypothetical protein
MTAAIPLQANIAPFARPSSRPMSTALPFVFALLAQRLGVWTHHPPWGAAGKPGFPSSTFIHAMSYRRPVSLEKPRRPYVNLCVFWQLQPVAIFIARNQEEESPDAREAHEMSQHQAHG